MTDLVARLGRETTNLSKFENSLSQSNNSLETFGVCIFLPTIFFPLCITLYRFLKGQNLYPLPLRGHLVFLSLVYGGPRNFGKFTCSGMSFLWVKID